MKKSKVFLIKFFILLFILTLLSVLIGVSGNGRLNIAASSGSAADGVAPLHW